MDFNYSEFQQMLVESAAKVVADHAGVEAWRSRRELPNGLSDERWKLFGELGWLGLSVAESAGGVGGTFEDVALLMIELGRGLELEPVVSTSIIGAFLVERSAPGKQRDDFLARVVCGDLRLALAHDEAGDRYADARPRLTKAAATDTGYKLSGTKTHVMDGPSAHHLIVTATIADKPGLALFQVPSDSPGVLMKPYMQIDGSHAADIRLDEVELPASALIANGDMAAELLDEALDRANVALLAQAVGSMEAAIDVCSSYLKERHQFGQPIGKFQSLQHLASDMLVASHQSRSALYNALSHLAGAAEDRKRAVALARVVGGEAMKVVSRTGIQLHGGYGLTDEYAIGHHFRRLMVIEKTYGDIDFHLSRMTRPAATGALS